MYHFNQLRPEGEWIVQAESIILSATTVCLLQLESAFLTGSSVYEAILGFKGRLAAKCSTMRDTPPYNFMMIKQDKDWHAL